jgi:hypothetical protein
MGRVSVGTQAQFCQIQIRERRPASIDVGLERLFVLTLLLVVIVHPLRALLLLPLCAVPGLGGTHVIAVPVVWWVDSTVVRPVEVALAVAGRNSASEYPFHLIRYCSCDRVRRTLGGDWSRLGSPQTVWPNMPSILGLLSVTAQFGIPRVLRLTHLVAFQPPELCGCYGLRLQVLL